MRHGRRERDGASVAPDSNPRCTGCDGDDRGGADSHPACTGSADLRRAESQNKVGMSSSEDRQPHHNPQNLGLIESPSPKSPAVGRIPDQPEVTVPIATTSKALPGTRLRVLSWSSLQRASAVPETYQLDPLSATMSPYVFIACRITRACGG